MSNRDEAGRLSVDFSEAVRERARKDSEFREKLLEEAKELWAQGEFYVAWRLATDYVESGSEDENDCD